MVTETRKFLTDNGVSLDCFSQVGNHFGETQVVTETRKFLTDNGVSLDRFSQVGNHFGGNTGGDRN